MRFNAKKGALYMNQLQNIFSAVLEGENE